MDAESPPLQTLRHMGRATLLWLRQWLYIARLAAQIMAWALSPGSYPRDQRPALARHIYQSAGPALLWYVLMFGLFGLVLVRIVVVSAQSYGLSRYALEMVVRVLVLELVPLTAALFVAMRTTIPSGSQLARLRGSGGVQGVALVRAEALPRVVAGLHASVTLAALSCAVALVMAYIGVYGANLAGLASYTRQFGQIFTPQITLVFVAKTLLFSLAVALIPMASGLYAAESARRGSAGLGGLARMFAVLLLIEVISLVGNYY